MKLSNDQINTLNLRFDYTIKNNAKQFVNTLIIGTENVIRFLYLRIQNSSVYVKMKKIKKNCRHRNMQHTIHERQQYNLKK